MKVKEKKKEVEAREKGGGVTGRLEREKEKASYWMEVRETENQQHPHKPISRCYYVHKRTATPNYALDRT